MPRRIRLATVFAPGDVIDIWVVEAALGQGGMGSVYRCHNQSARRILGAIKVLDVGLKRSPQLRARFVREAEILFALDHPNIVKVRNVRIDADPPYLEMAFVEGVSLEARLRHGPMSLAEGMRLATQMAAALAYLHGQGIRHRDVKPSNILVSPSGMATLVDFGIATESQGATLTESGQTFGSVCYVPPEWANPGGVDPVKWDLYALGLCIYEALTGGVAFESPPADSARQRFFQVIRAKQEHPPFDPGPEFPVGLRALIRQLTDADAERRPASADEVCAALDAIDLTEVDGAHVFSDGAWERRGDSRTMVPDVGSRDNDTFAGESLSGAGDAGGGRAAAGGRSDAGRGGAGGRAAKRGFGVAALVAGGIFIFSAAAFAGWFVTRPPPTRTVNVNVATDVVAVALDGGANVGVVAGVASIAGVAPGSHTVTVVRGSPCDAAAPAAWCGIETVPVIVPPGSGVASVSVTLATPSEKSVVIAAADGKPFSLTVDGGERVSVLGSLTLFLLPGKYSGSAESGACVGGLGVDAKGVYHPKVDGTAAGAATVAAAGPGGPQCTPSGCPPGCAQWTGDIVVPWAGSETVAITLPLTTPEVAAGAPAGAPGGRAHLAAEHPVVPPTPRPFTGDKLTVTETPKSSGVPVTNSQLSSWLASHPEWQKDAAIAAGKADANYLKGWEGSDAPAGKGSTAATAVSWAMADAYCRGRGGLAALDAEPTTWTESTGQPWHELRQDAGKPAWRRSDGKTSTAVSESETARFIGMRCVR